MQRTTLVSELKSNNNLPVTFWLPKLLTPHYHYDDLHLSPSKLRSPIWSRSSRIRCPIPLHHRSKSRSRHSSLCLPHFVEVAIGSLERRSSNHGLRLLSILILRNTFLCLRHDNFLQSLCDFLGMKGVEGTGTLDAGDTLIAGTGKWCIWGGAEGGGRGIRSSWRSRWFGWCQRKS